MCFAFTLVLPRDEISESGRNPRPRRANQRCLPSLLCVEAGVAMFEESGATGKASAASLKLLAANY